MAVFLWSFLVALLVALEGSYLFPGESGGRDAVWEAEDPNMKLDPPLADSIAKYLDLTADQMKLTAGNMANIDTPGYKTQGIDFEREFAAAMQSGGTPAPIVREVDGLVARPDGNTVSLDRESMELAKTQLQFRMGVELLKHEFNSVMSAIHADAK